MSSRQGVFGPRLAILFGILVFAGVGCRTCFHADASEKDACQGKPAGTHDIEVDDMGGVGVSDTCVVISWKAHHSVHWRPKSHGSSVSIAFLLTKKQPVPFQGMACGKPDKHENKLCVLTDCPGNCKTAFSDTYKPSDTDPSLNYYYYSPGVTLAAGGSTKVGSDPGIRIDP